MQLTFENLAELRDMIEAMGYVKRDTVTIDMHVNADDIANSVARVVGELDFDGGPADGTHPDKFGTSENQRTDTPAVGPAEPTRRKRRTKAEIEAEKAAQEQSATVAHPTHSEPRVNTPADPLANLKSEELPNAYEAAYEAAQAIADMAERYDGNDKLSHLNEGRAFIEKHGFLLYNETITLADVPPNIAGHSPEQVSRHRAAMAWKAAQLAKAD